MNLPVRCDDVKCPRRTLLSGHYLCRPHLATLLEATYFKTSENF